MIDYYSKEIPILKSLLDYQKEDVIPLHMPGHKKGKVYTKLGLDILKSNLLNLDVTEVSGIDNLHSPEGPIKEAQILAAKAFGADHTFFLANGTTAGIYSMIMAVTQPGDKIIVPRNCHRSVAGAVILGRLIPVYIQPEVDDKLQIAMGISPCNIEHALTVHPDAKAVVITNPTYHGVCSDIKGIAAIVHKYEKLLLVDEAHGAHFTFHHGLPISALEAGADIAAQSTHKTLPSMTQSSMLHVRSKKVDLEKLRFFLQLAQSTSPSHVLMASLDLARYVMEKEGSRLLDEIIEYSCSARDEINKIEGIYCLGRDRIGSGGVHDIDETRMTVNFRDVNLTGNEVETFLRQDFKIQVEMSDVYNIVAITTVGDDENAYIRLVQALREIKSNYKNIIKKKTRACMPDTSELKPEPVLLPWEAVYREKEMVDWRSSIGKISGDMLIPYPPGIPIIVPGEVITKQHMDHLRLCLDMSIKINGAADATLNRISVLK